MVFDYLKELAGLGEAKKEIKEGVKETLIKEEKEEVKEAVKEEVKQEKPDSSWLSLDSWFSLEDLKKGLEKTRSRLESSLKDLLAVEQGLSEEVLEELEAALIESDMGVRPVTKLMGELRRAWEAREVTDSAGIKEFLKRRLKESFKDLNQELNMAPTPPTVIIVAGVNGSGKTTSIAKLGYMFTKEGKQVLLAAGDTFRAAAVEQLEIWSRRIGAQIIKHQAGADPAAVAYDALEAGLARGVDVVIVDTAGRLHTKQNLMQELGKIKRVISKRIEHAPHEVLMVLDATTGQNAISQAKLFRQAIDITGIFLAKLDGTAKGGIVIGMQDEIKIPVKFVGLGERAEDIQKFNPEGFVDALFD
ncbi:MAG: signal recognition particle-docking protein FtsY [Candidatus Brocadiales bacterium]|nr:signal recognition particle-docking protein FtsY [Candidatus Brocadiales bacterium]